MNSFRCRAQGFLSVFIPVMILTINGSVFAQWSRTAPNTYLTTSTDKVGIGTTTPSDVLDVRMPSTVNQAGLSVCGPTVTGNGSQPAVVFKRYNGTTLTTVSKVYSNNGDILFTTGTGTSPSDRMIIDNAGRVGIGTMTPGTNYKLDVNGVFHVINGNQALFSNSGTAALPSISFDNDQNTGLFNPNNADVIGFATQGSERMRIDQAGHVGIGTSSPGNFSLDVNGILHVANGSQALFSTTSTANIPAIAFDINNNTGFFSPSDDNLGFATGGQERMRINPNGAVGIGATNPGNGQSVSLHVNGPLMLTNIPALGGAASYYLGVEGSTGIIKTRTPAQVFSDISGGACPPNPMTALGDMLYGATAGACTRLPGNITTTKKFLSQTGTGSASAMPAWAALTNADVGLGNVENTRLSTWTGSSSITTLGTITAGSIPLSLITGTTGLMVNPMTTKGDLIYGDVSGVATRLPGNTSNTKMVLTQTGSGTVSATPAWGTWTKADVGLGDVENVSISSYLSSWSGSTNITVTGPIPWDRIIPASRPTTLVGYGITDAAPSAHGVTVGYMPYANSATSWATSPISYATGLLTATGADLKVTGQNWSSGNSAFLYLGDNSHYIKATFDEGVAIGTYGVGDALSISQDNGDVTILNGYLAVSNGDFHLGNCNLTNDNSGSLKLTGADMTVEGSDWEENGSPAFLYLGDIHHYIKSTWGEGISMGYDNDEALKIAQNTGDVTITKGNLSVTNGKINVKGWSIEEAPDYVFEKDYKLPKLNEVETYVKEHKHLADVPSAKDMNKNGLDITSMNMKLLKKIEELTLYSIEQNKKLEMQNKRIEELEKKVGR